MMNIDEEQARRSRYFEVSKVFTPTAPVDERDLFAGRLEQLGKVIDAVHQKGQHAIIYGERGVGKTSLVNVLADFLPESGERIVVTPRVNCDGADTFQSLFEKALREIKLAELVNQAGFTADPRKREIDGLSFVDGPISPDNVRRALAELGKQVQTIIIFDEFDRLNERTKRAVADAIKALSDHGVDTTLILVGVADTVGDLIKEHASIERAMAQIPMPRMSEDEIVELIKRGMKRLDIRTTDAGINAIKNLSQGLPHYAHLLCLHAARTAIQRETDCVDSSEVTEAVDEAISGAQQSILSAYHVSTMSPRKDNLFADVLLACAMSPTDPLGYFAAQDVRAPMQEITGKAYQIPSFSQHLNEFCEEKRGPILKKIGTSRRFRFRFINPLMQPYVIMNGVKAGKIPLTGMPIAGRT